MLAEFGSDSFERPNKHTGIPSEVSLAEELFGEFRIWFFTKPRDFEGLVGGVEFQLCRRASLNVTVGRAGPSGFDSNGNKGVGLRCDRETVSKDGLKRFSVVNELIRRENHHGRFRIAGGDKTDAEGNGWRSVPFSGFGKDIFGRQHVSNLADFRLLKCVSENENVLGGDEASQTRDGLIEQGGVVKKIEKLLRFGITAQGPEASAASAGKN